MTGDDDIPGYVRDLADKFDIADAEALEDALLRADVAGDGARWEQTGMAYHTDAQVAQHARLTRLATELLAELTNPEIGNLRPHAMSPEAEFCRRELKQFADWLATEPVRVQPRKRGNPGDEQSRAFIVTLAHEWPALTGEKPTAWKNGETGLPGGRFFGFLKEYWGIYWKNELPFLRPAFPSPTTIARWLDTHNS
jgi:plasmid stabilization system protein ParE